MPASAPTTDNANAENSATPSVDQTPKKIRITPPLADNDPRKPLEEELIRLRDSQAKDRETKLRIVALRRQLQELTNQGNN